MYSRRELGKIALAALPLPLIAAKIDSKFHGVQLGMHTYSFSNLPFDGTLDLALKCMVETGLGECILWGPQMEPAELGNIVRPAPGSERPSPADAQAAREKLAKWRMSVSLDYFKDIRKKFESAGVEIYGLSTGLGPSDEEIARTLEIAQALGCKLLTSGGTLPLAKRLAPMAEKAGIMVGFEGRPNPRSTDPNQISKPENYEEAASLSKNFRIDLDIGDATGGGLDVFQFVQEHHAHMQAIFLKDRRKDRTSMPWGEGDTPVKAVLQLIRDKQYPIHCYVDCDYKTTGDRAADVKRCVEYAKAALA